MAEPVLFWSQAPTEVGRVLSNFHPCSLRCPCHDYRFRSSEQAYFWHLASTTYARQVIAAAADAATAKRKAKELPSVDWKKWHRPVMAECLKWKFEQNEDLKALLLGTELRRLVHFTPWNDRYWGVGTDMKGENLQGKMLMALRKELRGSAPLLPLDI